MNTKIGFLICILIAALALTGWWLLRTKANAIKVPAGAKAGDIFLKPCSVKIAGVKYQGDCGTLVVPENRSNPDSRLIALPVKRIHSPSGNPQEPILYLAGGPGQSNMGFRPPAWLLAEHDVIMVGYRGVDGDPKLDCPEMSEAMLGVGGDLLSPASLDHLGAAMQTCAKRLQAAGIDLGGYTIPEVVEDMEAARSQFGYAQVNLLSESFGTRVAQIYAIMHPESLLRSAMIRVNPPGHFVWIPATTDALVEKYAKLCREDEACASHNSDLAASMRRVNQAMPTRWLFLPIDPGKVKVVAFALLFHRTTAPIVFDAYLSSDQGDPSGLALMSMAFDFLMPKMMTWGDLFAIGGSADFEPDRNYRSELTTPDAILGAPMSLLIWGSASNWPITPMPDSYRQVQPTDISTLLISGSVDFSTPPEFATQELLPSLRNGKHVLLSEQGHVGDFWTSQPQAAERMLTSFFATGAADDSLYAYQPMDFKPAIRFPLLAKILLGTGILPLIALGWAISGILRRTRRKLRAK